jgi:hypothetical protein
LNAFKYDYKYLPIHRAAKVISVFSENVLVDCSIERKIWDIHSVIKMKAGKAKFEKKVDISQ